MISVKVLKNKIEIVGHALYDDYGKDIVCSAVSSIVITTINGIISIDENAILYQIDDGKIVIDVKKDNLVTLKLIDNMIDLLKKLSKDYPKNIKVKEGV